MNWRIVRALVSKDFALFFRNRFFSLITLLGIAFYLIIYFVMPPLVDESLDIGLYAPMMLPGLEQMQEEGLEIELVVSDTELRQAVTDGRFVAGIALPANIMEKLLTGEKPEVSIYSAADTPQEINDAMAVLITELAYQLAGQPLAITFSEEIIGPDLAGIQIPPRDRMRPMFAVLLLVFETLGLANLISEEIERGTVHALLVTPVSTTDLFIAKGTTGVGLAFIQSVLFMVIVGGMNRQPLIVLTSLLLGAVLVTGIGFIISSLGKDMMSVMAWGFPALIILFIPTISVIFPGVVTGWVKVIPSYYLVDTVHRASNFGAGWGDLWANLLILLSFNLVFVGLGIWSLRRKTQ